MAPQVLQVLLCVQCTTFQVHIVKKSKKWECKVCGTKQTEVRVYGKGTGPECRILVQKLNKAKGRLEEESQKENSPIGENINEEFESESIPEEEEETKEDNNSSQTKENKWDVYAAEEEEDEGSNLF